MMRPQKVIQSTAQTPCRPPYRYARAIEPTGACQTQMPSAAVITPAMSVASHAVILRPASKASRTKSGTKATMTAAHKLPRGTSVWVNRCPRFSTARGNERPRDRAEGRTPGQRHRELQLRTKHFQRVANARFARRGETPQVRPTDERRPGAERQRLEPVGATSNPSVEENRHPAGDMVRNVGQGVDRRHRAIPLPPAVIGTR